MLSQRELEKTNSILYKHIKGEKRCDSQVLASLTPRDPLGDTVKMIDEPGRNVSSLKTETNFSIALASSSV